MVLKTAGGCVSIMNLGQATSRDVAKSDYLLRLHSL